MGRTYTKPMNYRYKQYDRHKKRLRTNQQPFNVFGIGVDAPLNQINAVSNPSRLSRQSIDSTNIRLKGNFSAGQPDTLGCSVFRCGGSIPLIDTVAGFESRQARGRWASADLEVQPNSITTSKSITAESIRSIHRNIFYSKRRATHQADIAFAPMINLV